MKSNNKWLTGSLCLLMVVFCIVGLTACGECKHEWSEWTIKTDATCAEAGVQERVCSKCDEVETATVDALGHEWLDATCETPKTCSRCSATEGDASGHTFNVETVKDEALKSAANCTDDAVYYKSCACGAISTNDADTFTATGTAFHTYTQEIVKADALRSKATCTGAAVYYKSCVCGKVSTSETETFTSGLAEPHTYTQEVVKPETLKSEATCTALAVYYKSCVCGAISTSNADTFTNGELALHTYTETVVKTETLKSAANCGSAAIYYKSCVCGLVATNDEDTFTSGSAAVDQHLYEEIASTTADCDTAETKTYKCSSCGDEYVDTLSPALGHDTTDVTPVETLVSGCEYVWVYECNECGDDVEGDHIFKHTYTASITTPATCKADGVKTLTCTCGDTKTEAIPQDATGHNWVKGTVADGKRTDTCQVCNETKSVTVYEGTSTGSTNTNDLKNTEIELNDANIKLDDGVIDSIGDKNVTVSADTLDDDDRTNLGLTEDQLQQVGNNPIYNFTINDGTSNISQFGEDNWVTITLPYTLSQGEDVDSIAVWFINDQGELESIKATYNNGYVTFKTNHFSYYTVTRLTPAERCALYGHSYSTKHVEGSCTADGYDLLVCVRCHDTKKENVVIATGHDYENKSQAATCLVNGYETTACKNCDYSYSTVIRATGHNWGVTGTVPATCTANGYTVYECSICHEEYTALHDKVAHEYESTVVPATCDEAGHTLHECVNCDASYTDTYVAALGHAYRSTGNWTWVADNSSAKLAFVCSHNEQHTMLLDATVNTFVLNGTCSNFTRTTYTATVPYGGTIYSDEKVVEVGTPGHQFTIDKYDGENHWKQCICGEKSEVTPHTFGNATETKAPTCGVAGESTATCACGATKVTVIPATGEHTFVNGECSGCGAVGVDNYYINLLNSYKNINGVAVKIENLSFTVSEKDTTLLEEMKQIGKVEQISVTELMLGVKDGEIYGAATGSIKIFNGPFINADAIVEFDAVISDGYAYVVAQYGKEGKTPLKYNMKVSVDALLASLMDEMDVNMADGAVEVVNFYKDTLIPALDALIAAQETQTDEILSEIFNMVFTIEMKADGSRVATLDYAKLHALNENLATKTVAEVIDIYFGEGSFDDVVEFALEILNLKVSEIPAYLDEKGLDSEDLFAKINELAKSMGAPDDYDVEKMLCEGEMADVKIGMLIFETEDDSYLDIFDEEIVQYLREYSLYEMIDEDSVEDIKASVAEIIDMIAEYVTISFTTDFNGMLTSLSIQVDALVVPYEDQEYSITFDLTIVINGEIDITWNDIIEEINGSIVMPDEEMLDDEPSYYYYGGKNGYITYQGEEYAYSNGIYVAMTQPNYDEPVMVMFSPDCKGWVYYEMSYAMQRYEFIIVTIEVDGEEVMLIQDKVTGEVAELVALTDGLFQVVYADGTTKEITFTIPEQNSGTGNMNGGTSGGIIGGVTGDTVIQVPSVDGTVSENVGFQPIVTPTQPTIKDEISGGIVVTPSQPTVNVAEEYSKLCFLVFEDAEGEISFDDYDWIDFYYNAAEQKFAYESQHKTEYEYVVNGDSCDDGCTRYETCENCDYYDEYTRYWCETEYVEIDLSEHTDCGGSVSVYKCKRCGTIESVYDVNTECQMETAYEEIKDANNRVIGEKQTSVCTECGLKIVSQYWREYESTCEFYICRSMEITKGEETILTYEYSYWNVEHDYEYHYELNGTTCEEGYTVTYSCTACGKQNYSYTGYGHSSEYYEDNLEEYGLCGGYVEVRTCKICETTLSCYVEDYNCKWLGEDIPPEYGYEVSRCYSCGVLKYYKYERTEKDENCRYQASSSYVFVKNGEEVYRCESIDTYTNHVYAYDFELFGTSCTDGYRVIESCKDCEYSEDYEQSYHEYFDFFELDDESCCDSHYVRVGGCPCGYDFNIDFNDYDLEFDEQNRTYSCERCGLVIENRVDTDTNGCTKTETTTFAVTVGDAELYRYEKTNDYAAHEFKEVSVNVVDGKTFVSMTCDKCQTERNVEILEAVLEEKEEKRYYYDFTFVPEESATYTITGLGDRDSYVELYRTNGDKLEQIASNDDGAGYNGQFKLTTTLNAGETYIYRIRFYDRYQSGTIRFMFGQGATTGMLCDHDYRNRVEFGVLNEGSDSCEDGALYGTVYVGCGCITNLREETEHIRMQMEYVDLSEYGACHGEFYFWSCACGEESDIDFYSCGYMTDNKVEEGVYVETHTCRYCNLRYDLTYYEGERENCSITCYYSVVISIGQELVFNQDYEIVQAAHDYDITGELAEGATSCEDGAIITYKCKDCGVERVHEVYDHELFAGETFDLAELGECVCGGYAVKYQCACRERTEIRLDETMCDWGQRWSDLWIEDAVTQSQQVINGWNYYGYDAHIKTCAVTDPACAYKIRYARYWLRDAETCMAYEYETWQFGYNEATGECAKEVTFKTGSVQACHAYVDSSADNQTILDCPDCGSYYHLIRTYDDNGNQVKYEKVVSNTLNDGNNQYMENSHDYAIDADGNSYVTREYTKYVYADGSQWGYENLNTQEAYEGPFGANGRKVITTRKNLYGEVQSTNEYAYVYLKGYQYDIYTYSMNGEWWERYDYTYTFDGECIRTETYTNSYKEDWTESRNICKYTGWTVLKEPTCTQDGLEGSMCAICESMSDSYTMDALDHDFAWMYFLETYCCVRCGLENINGASGDIIMEDMTVKYGNGENYVVGYCFRTYVDFTSYVCLILEDGTEVILDGIEIIELDGVRAYAFSKAAVTAKAVELGYEDASAYDVRFVFVPYGADSNFDYAITFTENVIPEVVAGSVTFTDHIGLNGKMYTITPDADGVWVFASFSNRAIYARLYDAYGYELDWRDRYDNVCLIEYELAAGETYTLEVGFYSDTSEGTVYLYFWSQADDVEEDDDYVGEDKEDIPTDGKEEDSKEEWEDIVNPDEGKEDISDDEIVFSPTVDGDEGYIEEGVEEKEPVYDMNGEIVEK